VFYKKYYQPDNAVLVVAGKFDETRTFGIIERKYGAIPRARRSLDAGNLLFATYTQEPVQDGERFETVRRVGDAQVLMAGYTFPQDRIRISPRSQSSRIRSPTIHPAASTRRWWKPSSLPTSTASRSS